MCFESEMSKSRPDVACLVGAWRRPPNDLQDQVVGGGHKAIHDDATAAKACELFKRFKWLKELRFIVLYSLLKAFRR